MILKKPKFWDEKKSLASILLAPITIIILIVVFIKKKIVKTRKFNIPIICIGNIYIGGTGKTPTSISIGNLLQKLGFNPVILRKYYKDHSDEHNLIINNFNNLILAKNRLDGIKKSEDRKYDSVILDDGFQDYSIHKDLNILCFNSNQLIGNGKVIPSGPLRERLDSLKRADIVIINGLKNNKFEAKILKINKNLEIFYSNYKPVNLHEFKNKRLLALAGIGNPENFFQLIENNNLEIKEKMVFPDHYKFTKNEIQKICDYAKKRKYTIITTEKDFFKVEEYKINSIKYLKVILKIDNQDRLIREIKKVYDKNY
tara:strand:- start:57 stop:998 length:942 start_codon:yes stop_codon:yes gene_type:complete